MSSSATSATWLPAALARRAVLSPAPTVTTGRHLAPENPSLRRIAAPEDLRRSGRHVESEWSRELHDPRRDEVDSLDWLGFSEG
jgi:hypothetical protein